MDKINSKEVVDFKLKITYEGVIDFDGYVDIMRSFGSVYKEFCREKKGTILLLQGG